MAGGFEVWVARADVNDEPLFALLLETLKAFHDAVHVPRSMAKRLPHGKSERRLRPAGAVKTLREGLWWAFFCLREAEEPLN